MGMLDTITRYLAGMAAVPDRQAVLDVVGPIGQRLSSLAVQSAGLEITGGSGTTAQIGSGSTFKGFVQKKFVTVAAGTDMPALVGTITANSFNYFQFTIDADETVSVAMGIESTTDGGARAPVIPVDETLIGLILVTHSSTFTGGSTALDAATTIYMSPVGAIDLSVEI